MKEISGTGNWKIKYLLRAGEAEILSAETCDADANLPDGIGGAPVTALAPRALVHSYVPEEGDEFLITCGAGSADWDNRKIRSLALPAGLKSIGSYALMNCRELETIRLHDGIEFIGANVLMNCRALHRIELTRDASVQGEALAYFVREIPEEMTARITEADGSEYTVIFPGFIEHNEENSASHHFVYTIEGGGYRYHSVFEKRQLNLQKYDALFSTFLQSDHSTSEALRVAWTRLRYPHSLLPEYESRYASYISANMEQTLLYAVSGRDAQGLRVLLGMPGCTPEALSAAAEAAREAHFTEAVALILEKNHSCAPFSARRKYEL